MMIPVSRPSTFNETKIAGALYGIMDRAWFTNNGPVLREFEEIIRERLKVPYFVAMANGTLALEAAVALLSREKTTVIIPSFTFPAVASCVVRSGCGLEFADIRPDTWTIDINGAIGIAARCSPSIIIAATVFGVIPTARPTDVPIIFDNAEGFGKIEGVFGTVDTYSFHATKIIGCGEGGGVACKTEKDATWLRRWRNFGFDDTGVPTMVGTNAKMSEFHAMLGIMSLQREQWQRKERARLMEIYRFELEDMVYFQDDTEPYNCSVLVPSDLRADIISNLKRNGIDCRPYFHPIHKMEPYVRFVTKELPVTDYVASRCLTLPLWAGLGEENVRRICSVIRGVIE